jgi:NAD(P)-dependent dehydrogenase (short-subunit alcohol dehydrogenase family)
MRKKAIITGGERGIGRGIAAALAGEGYDIAFSYYPLEQNAVEAVEFTHNLLKESGAASFSFKADLSQKEGAKKFFEEAADVLGSVDLLVNNAGVNKPKPIYEFTDENFDYLINLDFRSYIMMMSYASRYMKEHDIHGNIINITSSRGERAYPNAGLYCGMKAGINKAIEAFALDVAPFGIRINNVAPGAVRIRTKEEMSMMDHGADTDYFWDERFLQGAGNVDEDFWDVLGKKIPLSRTAVPEDIGNAVVFLASDKASYITGITLRVDGGLILPGMPEGSAATDRGWG